MDNGLVLLKQKIMAQISVGLNPFCNGQWSRTAKMQVLPNLQMSLNPFCNGQWSRTS